MRFLSALLGACAFASTFPTYVASELLPEIGHVINEEGKVYQLENTGHNIRVITKDRKEGYYIRSISYYVESEYASNFYSESTRGVGYLIGEFHGPVEGNFGSHWAAFYECWGANSEKKYSPAPVAPGAPHLL